MRGRASKGPGGWCACSHLHAHDREDELQREHHAEDVGDRRHHLEEQLDDEPHARVAREQAQRAEHAQDAQRLERPQRGEHLGEQAEPRDAHDEEVEHLSAARRAVESRRQQRARRGAVPLSSPAAPRALLSKGSPLRHSSVAPEPASGPGLVAAWAAAREGTLERAAARSTGRECTRPRGTRSPAQRP